MKLDKLKHLEKLSNILLITIYGGQCKKKKRKKQTESQKNDVSSDTTDTQKNDTIKN